MRKTEFLKLHLPDENEYYNVELDQNQNFIRVDEKLKEHSTALTTIQQGATNEQKGIVQFGTEEGKALEGMMLARLAGAYGFGGDIQNTGVKNQNYIYYDRNTRKMYKCLNQNSDTSANVANFIPLDNNSLLERLENLFTINNLRYDSGNLEKLINGNWQNIATISDNDKILSLTVFGNDRIRVYSYTFIISTLKYPDGIYFTTMSTANLGYVGGFIRVNGNTVQVKSTYNTSSHDYYVRNVRIYS